MKRRRFLSAAASTLGGVFGVTRVSGQTTTAPRRIGVLRIPSAAAGAKELQALRDGLRERGFAEGRDIVIDLRSADGRSEALPRLAAELAALRPSVIVTGGSLAADAVLAADPAVPIVVLIGDAIGAGLAEELKRPGGRVTGLSFLASSLDAKRLELLAGLLPKGSAVLALSDPDARTGSAQALTDTARSLGLTLHTVEARTVHQIELAFATARRLRLAGVNVLTSSFLNANRLQIIELSTAAKLPAVFQWPESAEDGGLLGYGPRFTATYAQLAGYVARILQGAKAGDLPMEQPTKFELVINLKTARAIGLTVPVGLLLRADRIIE